MIKNIRQFIRRHLVLSLLLTAIIVNLMVYLFTPNFPPENVRITNITDATISISWTTSQPTSGFIAYNQQANRFLRTIQFFCYQLPILARHGFKIGADEISNPSYTHHVTLKNLSSNTDYYYRIASGQRLYKTDKSGKVLPDIKTASVLENLPLPQPIFSRVFQKDGEIGAPNVLVYLTLIDGTDKNIIKSSTISAFTDAKGIWNTDLGNFRQFNKESLPQILKTDLIFVEAQGSVLGSKSGYQAASTRQPAQFIYLK